MLGWLINNLNASSYYGNLKIKTRLGITPRAMMVGMAHVIVKMRLCIILGAYRLKL